MPQLFFDIDTQIDFLFPAGALYVPQSEKLVPTIAALNRRAPILISTMCAHQENDPEFSQYPPHCIIGTVGQQKPPATLVPNQILFPKRQTDAFKEPKLVPLLRELQADSYILYGVVTEICVQSAAEGLLALGKPVTIITDAIQYLNSARSETFLRDFQSRGGKLTTSAAL
jgi:nicotinamidase/pyrazinamidase